MRKPKTRGYFEPWEAVRSHDWERGFSSEKGKRDVTDVGREKVLVFSGCNSHLEGKKGTSRISTV